MLTEQYSHGRENILANVEYERRILRSSEYLLPTDLVPEAEQYLRYLKQGRLVSIRRSTAAAIALIHSRKSFSRISLV